MGFEQRIDPELRSAVVVQMEYWEVYVMTSNFHVEEIRISLRMLAENVCVVQKKRKKEDFIRERFFGDGSKYDENSMVFLFIDDDIRDLVRTGRNMTRMARFVFF